MPMKTNTDRSTSAHPGSGQTALADCRGLKRFPAANRCGALSVMLAGFFTASSQAAVVINMAEQGSNVVATMSGTINLAALTSAGTGGQPGFMNPSSGNLLLGGATNSFAVYSGIQLPPNSGAFGSGGSTFTDSHVGDFLAIISVNSTIRVPTGYVSGAALSSTTTWNNATLATLGVTSGSYTWSWGSGASADSITLNVTAPSAVPGSGLVAIGSLGLAGLARRRRR